MNAPSPPRGVVRLYARRPSDAELEAALSEILSDGERPVRILQRRAMTYRSTLPLESLRLRRHDGSELDLVFKDASGVRREAARRGARAAFVLSPAREIDVYREVLTRHAISAPAFVGAITAPELERYWLFVERLHAVELWQAGGLELFERAARWLAELHARFADAAAVAELPAGLVVRDGAHFRRWLARAERFERRARVDWSLLRGRALEAAEWLDREPVTFLHGEFYPSNVLVERDPKGEGEARIRPVDWEMAGVGNGLVDLAALTSGRWSDSEREGLAEAYRLALPPELRPARELFRAGLERCRLLVAVQWLGWSPDWTPPPEHAWDWLAAARDLVEESPPAPPLPVQGLFESRCLPFVDGGRTS